MIREFSGVTLLVFGLAGCGKAKHDGLAAPVDPQKLEESSLALCPQGQKFQVNSQSLQLGKSSFPSPMLFTIQRGGDRCADLHNVDHGGLTSWLNITYSTDCIVNGALWLMKSISVHDGDDVDFDLNSLDTNENNWIHIYTSYGYDIKTMRSEIGLIAYSCQ